MKAMLEKLKSSSGESIAEVLAAMLVIALGIVMLVSMVSSSSSMIQKSEQSYADYMSEFNAAETQSGSGGQKKTVSLTVKGTGADADQNSYSGSMSVWVQEN